MADRGWAMDDRPTGLFERVRLPDADPEAVPCAAPDQRTGMFDEIDGAVGWYGGADLADARHRQAVASPATTIDGDPAARTSARHRLGHQLLELRRPHPAGPAWC